MKYRALKAFAAATLCAFVAACGGTGPERAAESARAMELAHKNCPSAMPVNQERMAIILDSAFKTAHIKTLNDAGMAICLDTAMPKAKRPSVYGHLPFAIFQPAMKERGPILRLWDDGKPPVRNRPFQAEDGFNRYSSQAIQGAAKIIEGKKFNMKPDRISIATDHYGCTTYKRCFGIVWDPAESHKDLIRINPELFPDGPL